MTTILGIKHPDVEATVLAADRQGTAFDPQTGFPISKQIGRKLYKSSDEDFCFGLVGSFDERVENFAQNFSQGRFDLEKAIQKGFFRELRETNLEKLGYELPQTNNLFGMILATRFNGKPRLYTCFPLGSVGERTYTSAGSGEQSANNYMGGVIALSKAQNYKTQSTNINGVIQTGLEALRLAQNEDTFSYGYDLLVSTPEGINDHYEELGDDFERKLRKVQRNYKTQNSKGSKNNSGKQKQNKTK